MSQLYSHINSRMKLWNNQVAFLYYHDKKLQSINYSDLQMKIERMANTIDLLGFKPGDRIGLMAENSIEWASVYLASVSLKLTPVLLDPDSTPIDLSEKLKIGDMRALFVSPLVYPKLAGIELPCYDISQNLKCLKGSLGAPSSDPDPNLAALVFTSGTTGGLKAVMITHENLIETMKLYGVKNGFLSYETSFKYSDNVNLLNYLPWHHIFGLFSTLILPIYCGFKVSLVDKVTPERIVEIIKETQPTFMFTVPRLVEAIARKLEAKIQSLSKTQKFIVKLLINVSAPIRKFFSINLGPLLFKKVHKEFGGRLTTFVVGGAPLDTEAALFMSNLGFNILEGYGLTESTGCGLARSKDEWNNLGNVGFPIPTSKVQIALPDENGVGEICMTGPHIMKGYFRNPEATRQTLVNGWLMTGDLGRKNEDGSIVITGRLKEMIMTSTGKKTWPHLIKKHYEDIPHMKDFAIVGIQSQKGDQIHAVVVPELIEKQETILNLLNKRSGEIPHHLRINQVHFVESIPKTATLKVKSQDLIKRLLTPSAQPENLEAKVLALLSRITNLTLNNLDEHLSDISLDSLGALEFVNEAKKLFNIELPVDFMLSNPTIRELCQTLQKPKNHERERHSIPTKKKIKAHFKTDHIFVTGATGVVGGYVVKRLLETTSSHVHCLVRAETELKGLERIENILQVYGIDQGLYEGRLHVYLGDITLNRMGLDEEVYNSLLKQIDLTIHSAAKVSLSESYDEIKKINVEGTREVISFSLDTKQKYFAFISSYSIMGNKLYSKGSSFSEEDYDQGQKFEHLGYERSKFEAEGIVRKSDNLNWMVFRLGNVFGDSRTGAYPLKTTQVEGIFYDMFKTVIETGKAMEGEQFYDMTPVDYIADAVIYLSYSHQELFSTYHLVNSSIKKWSEIVDVLEEAGFHVDRFPTQEYIEALSNKTITSKTSKQPYRSITTELIRFKKDLFLQGEGSIIDSKMTQDVLKGAGIECPPISSKLMQTYFDYCRKIGYMMFQLLFFLDENFMFLSVQECFQVF